MRHQLGSAFLAVSLLVGCGDAETASQPSESFAQQQAPLTGTDVDVAPECQGILSFVNGASFETLDAYLPSNVATNLVTQRATAPFTSLESVSAVPLVGEYRLAQIEQGARAEGYIGANCVGILDELAISTDDAAEMVALVNSISSTELHDILPYAWNGAEHLLNQRPFTSVQGIANTAGIGKVSLRNIRNAATLSKPLEALIDAVNAVPSSAGNGVRMARHFDWFRTMVNAHYSAYRQGHMECFGIDADILPTGANVRSNLAEDTEVRDEIESSVSFANRYGQVSSSVIASGMANLDALIAGRKFKGCYISYGTSPWSGANLKFFIDEETGFAILSETYWSE